MDLLHRQGKHLSTGSDRRPPSQISFEGGSRAGEWRHVWHQALRASKDRYRMMPLMRPFVPCFLRLAATLTVQGINFGAARGALPDANVSTAQQCAERAGNCASSHTLLT